MASSQNDLNIIYNLMIIIWPVFYIIKLIYLIAYKDLSLYKFNSLNLTSLVLIMIVTCLLSMNRIDNRVDRMVMVGMYFSVLFYIIVTSIFVFDKKFENVFCKAHVEDRKKCKDNTGDDTGDDTDINDKCLSDNTFLAPYTGNFNQAKGVLMLHTFMDLSITIFIILNFLLIVKPGMEAIDKDGYVRVVVAIISVLCSVLILILYYIPGANNNPPRTMNSANLKQHCKAKYKFLKGNTCGD